jgi:hypothetical protein
MTTATMEDLGRTIGAAEKVRPVVAIDIPTMNVYSTTPTGRVSVKRFGRLLEYVERPNRTPSGGRYTSRRVTVRRDDGTRWVGQFKNGAETVILRPFNGGGNGS